MGILFVSLFVFVSALRFPGSCVAVLLYILVAVTAAPDNHVGTRIFISGFMLGPMWLAISIGAIVVSNCGVCSVLVIRLCSSSGGGGSGFMPGPMWLAISIGAVVVSTTARTVAAAAISILGTAAAAAASSSSAASCWGPCGWRSALGQLW
uniref:Uncharacterized protein n=1 Tax=Tetradesmus obliquus TaxID=3088 RepID=A0A383WIQ7_TETOB|eukprot:jgi/Sobl393_1/19585/SZX77039.1